MRALLLAALAVAPLGCSFDGPVPGVRGQCAAPSADPICEAELETAEDACWKLVQCASIPIANDEDEDDYFDYSFCVRFFERLDSHRFDTSLSCVSAASCDQLRFRGSPDRPNRNQDARPLCLQHGDQP